MTKTAKPVPLKVKNGITARQKVLKTFSIDYKSEMDDRRYTGTFTTKKLSIADLATVGVRKSQLNGGMYHDRDNPGQGIDPNTDDFNAMISHIEIALVEVPDWWDFEEMTDTELISVVYEEVAKHENSFLSRRRDGDIEAESEPVGAGEGVGKSDQEEAGSGGSSSSVVDEEVQSSLEP